jgi:hypothetical protein
LFKTISLRRTYISKASILPCNNNNIKKKSKNLLTNSEPPKYFIGDSVINKTRVYIEFKDTLFLFLAQKTFKQLKTKGKGYFAFTNKTEIKEFEKITSKQFVRSDSSFYTMYL